MQRVTETRIEVKPADGAKKTLFVFFVEADKVVRLALTPNLQESLVGGTKRLVDDYGIIDLNKPVKDWLGKAEVQNDWRFYDKRGVQVVARLNRGECTLYTPPCGGVARYKTSCGK